MGVGEGRRERDDPRKTRLAEFFDNRQECAQPVSLQSTLQWQNKILAGLQWFLFKSGPCATSHIECGGFIRSDSHVPHPDIEIQFLPLYIKEVGKPRIEGHGYQVYCILKRLFDSHLPVLPGFY